MTKFYTLLAAAAISLTASAQQQLQLSKSLNGLELTQRFQKGNELATSISNEQLSDKTIEQFSDDQLTPLAVPTGSWKNLGTGLWFEALLCLNYSDIPSGLSWDVTIEESETTPGYYRLQPYNTTASYTYELLQMLSPTYVYVNATNPNQVYTDGDIKPFNGLATYSNLNTENDWPGYSMYGTLKDGVITFPEQSFAYYTTGWYVSRNSDQLKIALPGAEVKDYSLTLSAPYCEEDNDVTVTIKAGKDISSLKYTLLPGSYEASDDNNAIVAAQGYPLSTNITTLNGVSDLDSGLYSILMVGLDENNTVVAGTNVSFFIISDDSDKWIEYGTATFDDGIFSSVFSDVDPENLTVKVEENVSQPGYFRLVNPYENHTLFGPYATIHGDHNHYIYINATDPEAVYVEASPMGVDFGTFGHAMVWSWASMYIEAGYEPESEDLGTYKDNVITMPDASLLFAFNNYSNGSILTAGKDFKVTLQEVTGIENITADDENAPVEYYNLQGIRIANPEAGQIVIKRQGSAVSKVLVK